MSEAGGQILTVWSGPRRVGRIAARGPGMSFAYDPGVAPGDAVSLTMPVRVASYDSDYGLLPIFDTNLPEGYLRARIEQALAKRIGRVGPLDILALTGGNQIGRLRVLAPDAATEAGEPPELSEDIAALISRPVDPAFVQAMMERFALRSGVSGVMPKVLARLSDAPGGAARGSGRGGRLTLQQRDWLLKFESEDFPGLAANEFWCLEAARRLGLPAVEARLSADGRMLAVRRFDGAPGARLGFEDFCALNARTARDKYEGSVETGLFRRLAEFSDPGSRAENLRTLYRLVVLNAGLRNGDAHLKNFALLFADAAAGPFRLAPAFDLVTTAAWLPQDAPALTLEGRRSWPDRRALLRLAPRARLGPKEAAAILDDTAGLLAALLPEMRAGMASHDAEAVGAAMARAWSEGAAALAG